MTIPAAATAFGARLYAQLEPVAGDDEQNGWALLRYCDAIGRMFDQVDQLVRDTNDGPGWSALLDVDRAPSFALPWLGQLVGVSVDTSFGAIAQRQQISDVGGFRRGSPASIIAAAQAHLAGGKTVQLFERDGSAYQLTIVTFLDETPDAAAVEAAIRAEKPAGIVLTYLVVDGQTYEQLLADHPTYQNVLDDYADYQAVLDDAP